MRASMLAYLILAWTVLWLALGFLGGLGPVELGLWLLGLVALVVLYRVRRRRSARTTCPDRRSGPGGSAASA